MRVILTFIIILLLLLIFWGLYKSNNGFYEFYRPSIEKIEKEVRDKL